jgi:hypothetical protein
MGDGAITEHNIYIATLNLGAYYHIIMLTGETSTTANYIKQSQKINSLLALP